MASKVKVPKIKGASLSDSIPSPAQVKPNDEWETEDHFNTLMKAHDIQNDPDKMAKVHKLAGRKMGNIKSIQGLKDYAQAKYGKPGGGMGDSEPGDGE